MRGWRGMTSCILSMWKVLLVTNLRLGCDFVSCRPTAVTMITLLTTFAFNSRFETLDVDNIRIWIFPLLWVLNMLKYHNLIHNSSPVMPTLPLLVGDLRFFASSPALPLRYINLPLVTSTINIEYLVKNKTDLV